MLSQECVRELRTSWLPNISDAGLDRLIDLLEKDSPLLIHGSFSRAFPWAAWPPMLPGTTQPQLI